MKIKYQVTITLGHVPHKPTETKPHVIPDDTDARSPLTHPYYGKSGNIPLVHRYNTISRRIQGHDLMANHTATVQPLNPPNIAVPTYSVQKTGEDWSHTNNTTGDVTIQTGRMNTVICPETGKPQEYRHLMKGPDKKMEKSIWKRDRKTFPKNTRY